MSPAAASRPYLIRKTLPDLAAGESVPHWELKFLQLTRGAFGGSSWNLDIEGLQILREDYSGVTLNVYGRGPRRSFIFNLPLAMREEGVFNGANWHDGICIARGEREFNVVLPPADLLTVVVDADELVRHVQDTEHLDASDWLRNRSLVVCDPEVSRALGRRIAQVLSACSGPEVDLATPAARRALRASVLEAVAPLVARHLDLGLPSLREMTRPQLVRSAREFVMEHIHEPLQVIDLCRATGACRRALQASFQEVLGVTPLNYIRLVRLNGARQALLNPAPRMQVRDVVEKWGIWHLGRFGSDYRALYGELPSETLRRLH